MATRSGTPWAGAVVAAAGGEPIRVPNRTAVSRSCGMRQSGDMALSGQVGGDRAQASEPYRSGRAGPTDTTEGGAVIDLYAV
ncbi:hypothetical protein GCM10010498_00970 [Streptomyces cavourensis]|nr:hypothetical protein GCM10010498_00970 [Streptomyces cavourensis]